MILGQIIRRSPHPAPVGRPDFYKRELHPSLFVRSSEGLPTRHLIQTNTPEVSALDRGAQCHRQYGFFPINFSFPQPALMPTELDSRPHFLSSTYPGEPFSFTSWDQYLAEYRGSYVALSTRKGGWDTFRHLEILFSGAIPLMPGLDRSHPWSLALFPKQALGQVYRNLVTGGPAIPSEETRSYFQEFARTRLTSQAMAEYLVSSAGLDSRSILFLDRTLPERTDYLSAFVFIGLSQLNGIECQAAWEPAYLYDDYEPDTATLYGRGFGYTRTIPHGKRSTMALPKEAPLADVVALADSHQAIVVGNYDANRELVADLIRSGIPAEKFVCVVGSDLVPDFRLRRAMAKSPMTFFVREFA